ncbi:apolipoprotein N-acyltransferase [Methylobrevis albus]|uniref:Apolipoprotein N-acyltransferase n=1 Tax=Methylobrevis albus TaxID=2793297 RepID=A0A931I4I1_9HYPH|nr:apolipoprotein N-acyltransferase [Methylobrevis albus]MBH0238708.1 apolipoprotein N-acyltransferase [Methylobrevis albus]
MRAIVNAVILSWGWRRLMLAFVAGAVSALAQAPMNLAPVLFLTFPVLVLLLDGAVAPAGRGVARLRPAAVVGWWFGFGYFLAGLWWIGAAFLVEPEIFGWMMPFAVVALPAGLAIFWAAGCALARLVWSDGAGRLFALAAGLTAAEWLRGHLFTGFPWNLIGQAFGAFDVTAQAAALIGVYGLTLAGCVVFAAPVLFIDRPEQRGRGRTAMLALAGLLVAANLGFGLVRLGGATEPPIDGLSIRIAQPAIDQSQKWSPEGRREALETYLALSESHTGPDTLGIMSFTHVVWPETALPFFLTESPEALAMIAEALPPGTLLVTGAPRGEGGPGGRRYFNSVYALDDQGTIVGSYDKAHLVPFGEYLPFPELLSAIGLRQLTEAIGGFTPGPGPRTLSRPGAPPFGVLICYEIIFPDAAVDRANRPGWIVNVTNDGWFGTTFGPYQHLAQARMRAIEEGLPVVRAANTGISAIIDPYGRILSSLGLGEAGVVDGALPTALPPTPYARFGRLLFVGLFIMVLVAAVAARARGRGTVDTF